MGLGHTRRNLAIASALTELSSNSSVIFASSGEIGRFSLPKNVDVLTLPGLRKLANERYGPRRLPMSLDDITELRTALLTTAVRAFRPSVLLADKHPFGVNDELMPALKFVRETGGHAVLGLRDILDRREQVLLEWSRQRTLERVPEFYDDIFVYGQSNIFDPAREYQLPLSLARRLKYCGYVMNETNGGSISREPSESLRVPARSRPLVLATIGGGDDGHSLLEAFVEAAHRGQWNGMVVVGPLAADDKRNHIRELATKRGVRFYDFLPNLSDWFARVDALVCMGGYNTLGEALSVGTPIVCVPRTAPRQEQLMRARALARLGLLRVLKPNRLDVSTLRLAVEKSVKTSRRVLLRKVNAVLNFDGAFRAARNLLEIAAGGGIQEDSIRRVANWGSSGFKMDNNEPVTPTTPLFPSINSGQTLRPSEGDLSSLPDSPLQSPLTVAQARGLAARSNHSKP